jgi:hypothetical protein
VTADPKRTWRIAFDDGNVHVVDACLFRENGTFTEFLIPGEPPVFAASTGRIVSISRDPDDGGEQPSEPGPAPDDPAPTGVTINVHGSVLSERNLRDAIEKQLHQFGQRQVQAYKPYLRH